MTCVKTWLLEDSSGHYYYIEQQPYHAGGSWTTSAPISAGSGILVNSPTWHLSLAHSHQLRPSSIHSPAVSWRMLYSPKSASWAMLESDGAETPAGACSQASSNTSPNDADNRARCLLQHSLPSTRYPPFQRGLVRARLSTQPDIRKHPSLPSELGGNVCRIYSR